MDLTKAIKVVINILDNAINNCDIDEVKGAKKCLLIFVILMIMENNF